MKLGILKCDRVRDVFASVYGQYPQMFANLLRPVDPEVELIVYDVECGELPADIHEVDAYLITGSRHGVNDGFPWIAQLEAFVRHADVIQKKIIGICFGHQLIAKALGGEVIKSPKGWGVGMSQNQAVQQKNWMQPYQSEFNILVSHQDQVVVLPEKAEVVASSDFCQYYMMQIGTHFLTIQGHPEFTKEYSRDLMATREDTVNQEQLTRGLESLELHEDDGLIAQWIMNFLKCVA